jgi:hypothetical protein
MRIPRVGVFGVAHYLWRGSLLVTWLCRVTRKMDGSAI